MNNPLDALFGAPTPQEKADHARRASGRARINIDHLTTVQNLLRVVSVSGIDCVHIAKARKSVAIALDEAHIILEKSETPQ